MRRLLVLIPLVLILSITPALAQLDECPAIVQQVLENLDEICSPTERNEACYGNLEMEAIPREAAEEFEFDTVGDIEEVVDIETLRLSPMREDSEMWGVALLRLQANLPDALPGQGVTFLLFGDVEIINAVPPESTTASPMQAFYLRTGVGDAACAEAPESGLLVRTPEGIGEVNFSVNGVDVSVGSTVFLQAQPGESLIARTYEGSAALTTRDGTFPIIAGAQRRVPMTEDLLPAGPPEEMTPYEEDETRALPPYRAVREPVRVSPPLSDRETQVANTFVRNGQPLCDRFSFMPRCDTLIGSLGGDKCPLNEAGEPDCNLVENRRFSWDLEVTTNYGDSSVWEELRDEQGEEGQGEAPEVTEEPTVTPTLTLTPTLTVTPTPALPEGCTATSCSEGPLEDCLACPLCGVDFCEANFGDGAMSEVDSGEDLTEEELDALCAETPDDPRCLISTATPASADPGDGGGDDGGGDNNPPPATEPPAVEPTNPPPPTDPGPGGGDDPGDDDCIPSPFDDCGIGFPPSDP